MPDRSVFSQRKGSEARLHKVFTAESDVLTSAFVLRLGQRGSDEQQLSGIRFPSKQSPSLSW